MGNTYFENKRLHNYKYTRDGEDEWRFPSLLYADDFVLGFVVVVVVIDVYRNVLLYLSGR